MYYTFSKCAILYDKTYVTLKNSKKFQNAQNYVA